MVLIRNLEKQATPLCQVRRTGEFRAQTQLIWVKEELLRIFTVTLMVTI
jgi:hypothetical protein